MDPNPPTLSTAQPQVDTMHAVVYAEYGPPEVLRLAEVRRPSPAPDEILIRVHATSINFGDLIARNFGNVSPREFHMPWLFWLLARLSFGRTKPKRKILGNEFAGLVEAVGAEVERFSVGEPVFGYRSQQMGAYAEYLCLPESGMVVNKPDLVSFEEAAVLPYGAVIMLSLLRRFDLQPGRKVLINGASGGNGSAALQLAKHYGAQVTGVCGAPRTEFVRALGADRVIDYTQEDFTQSDETYDLIIDPLGQSSFSRCKDLLTPNGVYFPISFKSRDLLDMLWTSIAGRRSGKKVICAVASERLEDLMAVKRLIEAGAIKALLDRRFPLEQTAEAHRYVEAGHKRGHIAITVARRERGESQPLG